MCAYTPFKNHSMVALALQMGSNLWQSHSGGCMRKVGLPHCLILSAFFAVAIWSPLVIAQGPPPPPPPSTGPHPGSAPSNPGALTPPVPAASLRSLPTGYARTSIKGKAVYFANGSIYQRVGNSYEPVTLPPGTRIDMLPPGSHRDRSFSDVVYENNGIRFKRNKSGHFEVLSTH